MSDNDKKIYKYGDTFYSFEEIYNIFKCISFDKKKKFKDCFAHFTLAQILKKSGLNDYAISLEVISVLEKRSIEGSLSKLETFVYNKEYSSKIKKLFSLSGKIDEYKVSEFINGEWLLNKLVGSTLGSSYTKDGCDEFSAINCDELMEDECLAIGKNFIRNMRNEEMIFYKSRKRLEKQKKV